MVNPEFIVDAELSGLVTTRYVLRRSFNLCCQLLWI